MLPFVPIVTYGYVLPKIGMLPVSFPTQMLRI